MKSLSFFIAGTFLLASCTVTPKKDPNYFGYLNAIQNYHPKLVEIKAKKGETIELKGVAEFIVYAPSTARSSIAPYRTPEAPAVSIFRDVLHTGLTAATSILPAYFGWHYGSIILKKAFDKAGPQYNVGGNYNTGTYTAGDYVGADKIQGSKYMVGGDYTGADKNTVTGDYITGTKSDYTDSYNTTTTTTTTTETTHTATVYDNSTGTVQ